MTRHKGDRVKVIADPYPGMGIAKVGDEAVVTKAPRTGSTRLVSLRFTSGTRVQCWMMQTGAGTPTLEIV